MKLNFFYCILRAPKFHDFEFVSCHSIVVWCLKRARENKQKKNKRRKIIYVGIKYTQRMRISSTHEIGFSLFNFIYFFFLCFSVFFFRFALLWHSKFEVKARHCDACFVPYASQRIFHHNQSGNTIRIHNGIYTD